jgi:hypothetical protein
MTELSHRDRAALVGLADGTLPERAHRRAEARVRAVPDADRLIARQRRVARALGTGLEVPVAAPARRSAAPRLVLAGALAAVLVAIAVLAPRGERSTVEQAADLAKVPATQAAPEAAGPALRADVEGVRFPSWGEEFGWHATGMRRETLDGRRAETVYYEHEGHRIAYTIIAGRPLPRPEHARVIRRDGLEISVYHDPSHGGHDVAVFRRGGRTCVLAGHVLELETLIKLAAWQGDGALRS